MINKWPKECRLGAENIILGRNKLEDQTKKDCPLLRTVDSIVRCSRTESEAEESASEEQDRSCLDGS